MTSEIKRKQGYEVHVVNFMEMDYSSDRYNPFDYVREEIQASTVANTIVASKNDPTRKDFWYNAQFSLLKALILYAVHELPPVQRNMAGVLGFLQEFDPETSASGASELDEQFLRLDKTHPARRAYELGFKKSQEKTRANIIVSMLTTIGDFTSSSVSRFTSFSDFFWEMWEEGKLRCT
ncbi:type IV secretory system conjugative DNA transfer family protein [Bacillus sp. TE8-1]|uniref:type IV secretory system conjugative DNA transfer family protein n=1 Tax=Bacillus sp. TE8-1 TaxID=2217829 RepID=UPI0021078048|nr:type IV secretory system conjugative DNA transfer family protein [Bacillus sp. TE8-1]